MFPILFRWNTFALHTYGLLVALGFLLAYGATLRIAARENLPKDIVTDGAWTALIGGLIGARLLYVIFEWPSYSTAPLDIFKIWQGGLILYGGFLGGALAYTLWLRAKKQPFLQWAEVMTPGLALGHAIGRLGCFFAGCCYGRACELPWAVTFHHPETLAPVDVPLHPSQIYESGLTFALFALLYQLTQRPFFKPGAGRLLPIYMVGYGLIRFAVEFTRGDHRGPTWHGWTATQGISLILIAAGTAVWFRRRPATTYAH